MQEVAAMVEDGTKVVLEAGTLGTMKGGEEGQVQGQLTWVSLAPLVCSIDIYQCTLCMCVYRDYMDCGCR